MSWITLPRPPPNLPRQCEGQDLVVHWGCPQWTGFPFLYFVFSTPLILWYPVMSLADGRRRRKFSFSLSFHPSLLGWSILIPSALRILSKWAWPISSLFSGLSPRTENKKLILLTGQSWKKKSSKGVKVSSYLLPTDWPNIFLLFWSVNLSSSCWEWVIMIIERYGGWDQQRGLHDLIFPLSNNCLVYPCLSFLIQLSALAFLPFSAWTKRMEACPPKQVFTLQGDLWVAIDFLSTYSSINCFPLPKISCSPLASCFALLLHCLLSIYLV